MFHEIRDNLETRRTELNERYVNAHKDHTISEAERQKKIERIDARLDEIQSILLMINEIYERDE